MPTTAGDRVWLRRFAYLLGLAVVLAIVGRVLDPRD